MDNAHKKAQATREQNLEARTALYQEQAAAAQEAATVNGSCSWSLARIQFKMFIPRQTSTNEHLNLKPLRL